MIFESDGDNCRGDSDSSSDFRRSKENPNNLRLRNPISTTSESLDVEMPQIEQITKEDSKRKNHSNITWFSSTRRTISQIARCLSPCFRLANRHRGISLLISLVMGIILYLHFKQVYMRYMGKHALHGGRIGQRIDAFFTRSYAQSVYDKRKTEFKETSVDFPALLNVGLAGILELQTNDALREAIIRAETMAKQLRTLENMAEEYEDACLSDTERTLTTSAGLPSHIFVPDHHAMLYPVPDYLLRIPFREANMRSFIKVNHNSLLKTFDSLGTLVDRTNLWALVMVYHFGGIYMGNHASDILQSSTNVLQTLFQKQQERVEEHCRKPTSVIAFAEKLGSDGSHHNELALIAATPRHPHLKCVLEHLTADANLESITRGIFFASSVLFEVTTGNLWKELIMQTTGADKCSVVAQNQGIEGIEDLADKVQRADDSARVFAIVLNSLATNEIAISSPKSSISEEVRLHTPKWQRKLSLRTLMKSRRIEPGWLCARCLRAPVMGTLQKCYFFCPTGYADLICSPNVEKTTHDVTVRIGSQFQHELPLQPRIPRIVHQTWFEDITLEAYPQLARLQNSWMNSGWEYRFYDDNDARDYIDKNFPRQFREAYDALVPGAFKVGERSNLEGLSNFAYMHMSSLL
jgi:mannosyltransferase OCH1-like enzyme